MESELKNPGKKADHSTYILSLCNVPQQKKPYPGERHMQTIQCQKAIQQ